MKKDHFLSKVFFFILFSGVAMAGCSSSHDEAEEDSAPGNSGQTVSSGEYGLVAKDVRNYFNSVLNGTETAYETSGVIESDQIDGAQKYVWGLWAAAVNRNTPERLPVLSSHYNVENWYYITTPDGTWKLPDGNMEFFYGSKGEKPADGYPLFIFLHGSGADAEAEWRTNLSWIQVFEDAPSVYFVPQSPQGGTGCRWYQPSRQQKWENIIRQAFASGNINPDKIYFAGISEGAYGSQRLASFYADYLAGAGPIAGGEFLVSCPPENLANIAFSLQTGEDDTQYGRKLLTQKAGSMLDALEAAHPGHYVHQVELQPGEDHSCNYTLTTPWLINYSRNPNPKYVYWENFALGGINGEGMRYRDAFYNLYIVEPSDDRSDDLYRTAYEMNIDGNVIDLKVNNVTLTPSEPASGAGWSANIGVDKSYAPATKGKVRIYLNKELVDLSQPVVVKVNGVEKFNGAVTIDTHNMVESCTIFYDPARVYPAAVEVSVQ